MKQKTPYVILGSTDYYSVAYSDVLGMEDVIYCSRFTDRQTSFWGRLLTRLTFHPLVNRYIKTPFKSWVYPRMLELPYDSDAPICFLFFECWYSIFTTSYMEYLRSTYPKATFVLYLQDLVHTNPAFDISVLRHTFDHILSYDPNDSKTYGLHYYPTPYSRFPIANAPIEYDICFVGHAKDRLHELLHVYEQCTAVGLRCAFYIQGVREEDKQYQDTIVYNHPIRYVDNLSLVVRSRCVLEIGQHGGTSNSLRQWEAIMYDKHLLTNHRGVVNASWYNDSYVHLLEDLHGKDDYMRLKEALSWPVEYSSETKDSLSPKHLLAYIDGLIK